MRPRQWLKNVLVFAAPLAAGSLFEPDVLVPSLVAFVAFCLMSSATYLVNDVRDVESDRAHPTKRARPIAAGQLSPASALVAAAVLAVAALGLALWVNVGLFGVLLAYALFTLSYSLFLKHEPVIELALLSMGFLLRAIAGGVAAELPISRWFLIVAGFGSLFMAAGKRFSELEQSTRDGNGSAEHTRRSLAGYTPAYLRFVWGTAAAVDHHRLLPVGVRGGAGGVDLPLGRVERAPVRARDPAVRRRRRPRRGGGTGGRGAARPGPARHGRRLAGALRPRCAGSMSTCP